MATSPREELCIPAITEFALLEGKWFWRTDKAGTVDDYHDETPHDSLDDAIAAFLEHEGVDPAVPVPAEEAHLSKPLEATGASFHIRHYAYGAPDPLQVVAP